MEEAINLALTKLDQIEEALAEGDDCERLLIELREHIERIQEESTSYVD